MARYWPNCVFLVCFLPKLRRKDLMRDQKLLRVFVNHLHETGALSVPPEDLDVAVEDVADRFATAESLESMLVVIDAVKEESNAEK